ncbi:biopolymer transporter ExbD [bacterium]|nr:biopolymer transporter ExbD [bacterium]
MAFSSVGRERKTFNEINITPLTDIFLVLLIIMMVVAPSFQSVDTQIEIPEINSGVSVEETNATVAITKDGAMYLNDKPVANEEVLAVELSNIKESLKKKEVLVKADSKTKSSEIMKVMRAAQEAEYEKLTVAGEPLTKKEQTRLQEQVEDIQ